MKWARRIAYVVGGLVVLVIALGAVALHMADTPAVRAEIQRRLSDAVQFWPLLRGEVHLAALDKFDLLGRILSIANFSGITELHKATAAGIPYRTIVVGGHFEGGQFVVQEAGFDSNALRLAASGRVGIVEPDTQLTVLVAPLARVDRVVGAIPILGNVLGGVLTTVPVAVSGDIRDPLVVPLGPHAVTDQLLGVFERTLKLPAKLVVPPPQ